MYLDKPNLQRYASTLQAISMHAGTAAWLSRHGNEPSYIQDVVCFIDAHIIAHPAGDA